jgi:hypothetical protein
MSAVPRRDGKKKGFRFGKKSEDSTTVAQIGAMAKSGALRYAGDKPTADDRHQLHSDINDVKYEAQYGHSGRYKYKNERLPKAEALRNAAQAKDKGEI